MAVLALRASDADLTLLEVGQFDDIAGAFQSSPLMCELIEMAESGDFARLESQAKRQHFVPQLLLREFSRRQGQKHYLFQLDVGTGKPLRVETHGAASRHRFYKVIEDDGVESNRIEGYLALVESHAAPALRRLLDDPLRLSDADQATLAFFFSLQTQRTPAAAEQINRIANSLLQTLAGSVFSDRKRFTEQYHEMFGQGASPEEVEAFRQETISAVREGRVRAVDRGGAAFSAGIHHAAEQSFMLFDFDWTLLRCPGVFVTSDRAFAMHDPTPQYPWSTQGILSSPNVETTIPLSENVCLLLRPIGRGLHVQDISPNDGEALNLRTYGWADNYIFGATQAAVVDVRKAVKARPTDVVKPRPQCQVTILDADPDDDSFAEANRKRGWPARLPYEGELHDYVVIPFDRPRPELHARVDEAFERRIRKQLGVGEEAELDGRFSISPIHPLDIG